jgi:Zn-dependent protease
VSSSSPSSLFRPPLRSAYVPVGPHERFSRMELEHLSIAYCVLTLALFLVWNGGVGGLILTLSPPIDRSFLLFALVAAAAAGLSGFVAHEMAHKFTAQSRGLWAEFRMSPQGLAFSLIFAALIGFLFATPGATVIGGRYSDARDWGITSLAGPATNLAESGIVAGGLALAVHLHPALWTSMWADVAGYVVFINIVFCVFNLIPWGPLDGLKIYRWNKGIWATALLLGIAAGVLGVLYLPFF